jgi:hypothetical protein
VALATRKREEFPHNRISRIYYQLVPNKLCQRRVGPTAGMSALGQNRSFTHGRPNVRFAPKAVIRRCDDRQASNVRLSKNARLFAFPSRKNVFRAKKRLKSRICPDNVRYDNVEQFIQ